MRRAWFLLWKELLELRQDPRAFAIVFMAPVVQLVLLGYAATTDVVNVPVVVVDGDHSSESARLIATFEHSPYFSVEGVSSAPHHVDRDLQRGTAWMALTVPAGFGRRVAQGRSTSVQLIADGSDATSVNVALGYASNLVASLSRDIAVERGAFPRQRPGLDAEMRVWFNPELRSRHFMVPGVLALILLVMTTILAAMAVVRERELGTLEQLNVTPVRRWELIAGKLLPYAVIGVIDIFLVLAVAVLWFEIPFRGEPALLVGLSLLFIVNTLGIGLFISTISDTQQQAMMTAVFFFLVPMIYLSGFIFPIENMPAAIQPFTALIPLRYYLIIVRGIFLKGLGLADLWYEALNLAGFGLFIFSLAVWRYRKTAA